MVGKKKKETEKGGRWLLSKKREEKKQCAKIWGEKEELVLERSLMEAKCNAIQTCSDKLN